MPFKKTQALRVGTQEFIGLRMWSIQDINFI